MAQTPTKVEVRCPHCGNGQLEPWHAVSTYCRSCGDHFDIASRKEVESLAKKLAPSPLHALTGRKKREVLCYRCEGKHEVSTFAKNTICPSCNAAIEFGNVVIASNASRPIDTRGRLTIKPSGNLQNGWIVCGEAVIQGKISGTLRCEGEVLLATSGVVHCNIHAGSMVVDKKAAADFTFPLHVQKLEIAGKVQGQIYCEGQVFIRRTGSLEGTLHARSVVVEKGGELIGRSTVAPQEIPTQPEEQKKEAKPAALLQQMGLPLGATA